MWGIAGELENLANSGPRPLGPSQPMCERLSGRDARNSNTQVVCCFVPSMAHTTFNLDTGSSKGEGDSTRCEPSREQANKSPRPKTMAS